MHNANKNNITVREAAVELQNAGITPPANLPKISFAHWVRREHSKLVAARTRAAAPKQTPKAAAPKAAPKRTEEPVSPFAAGSRFIKSRTTTQLRDLILGLGGKDTLLGTKSELAKEVERLQMKRSEETAREIANAGMTAQRRRQKWQAKAAKAAAFGIELADSERRTGIYGLTKEIDLAWLASGEAEKIATGEWLVEVLRELAAERIEAGFETLLRTTTYREQAVTCREVATPTGLRFEFKPEPAPKTVKPARRVADEDHDKLMDRVFEAHRRSKAARLKRDREFVKREHRKARGQRHEAIAPDAEPAVVSLIDTAPESNPGRW